MPRKYDSKLNMEFTDAEICSAIRYLDPTPSGKSGGRTKAVIAIGVSLLLLVGYLAIFYLRHRIY
jgi:hypothetical protein